MADDDPEHTASRGPCKVSIAHPGGGTPVSSDPLTTYIEFATVLVRRDRFLHQRIRELSMATPAAIARLTEHATRAKALMADTEKTAPEAEMILNNYEATLARFKAGLSQVKENEKDLAAVIQGMGNATEVVGDAFRPSPQGEQQIIKPEDVGDAGAIVNGAPKSG